MSRVTHWCTFFCGPYVAHCPVPTLNPHCSSSSHQPKPADADMTDADHTDKPDEASSSPSDQHAVSDDNHSDANSTKESKDTQSSDTVADIEVADGATTLPGVGLNIQDSTPCTEHQVPSPNLPAPDVQRVHGEVISMFSYEKLGGLKRPGSPDTSIASTSGIQGIRDSENNTQITQEGVQSTLPVGSGGATDDATTTSNLRNPGNLKKKLKKDGTSKQHDM